MHGESHCVSRRTLLVAAAATVAGCASAPTPAPQASGAEWQPFVLPGKRATKYVFGKKEGRPAWHAHAESSASMLRRHLSPRSVDGLVAEFGWWVPRTIAHADLSKAESADSPVRVAFAFGGDHARLPARTRMQLQMAEMLTGEEPPYATLMYVWDNHAPVESVLTSRRSDRVRKLVLECGPGQLGQWRAYRRQLAVDFRRAFGEEPGPLLAIALMTDADNTGSSAEAWYSDVVLRPA